MSETKVDQSKLIKVTDDFFIFKDGFLGAGAFGQVHKGWWKSKNKIIAIKHIQVSQDYERQIQTLTVLSTLVHPNIMGFYGYEHRKNDVYMFVQFCPNGDLTGAIKKGLSELETLKYFRQMVEGMCYMNAKSKMHRDLKPDNILIGMEKDLKISDFGLARQTQNIMITGKKGTPIYAGPQVYLSSDQQGYTQKCDVWGGGLILYEMLTGEMLFKHVKTYPQLKEQWALYQRGAKRVQYTKGSLNPLWEYFTNIMLTFDPKKRPTYREVLEILKKVYNKMQKQISTGTVSTINNPKQLNVQNYLIFQSQKFGILTSIAQKLNQIDFPLKKSLNQTILFLCISKYLTHMKRFIRDLKHKNISLPGSKEDIIDDENKDYEIVLCMDKYRNIIDTSYTFYSDQLKNKVIEKLLNQYVKQPEQQAFFSEFKELIELMKDITEGLFDVQQTYSQKLLELVQSKYVSIDQSVYSQWNQDSLKLYIQILLSAKLDENFPKSKYANENFVKNYLDKVLSGNKKDFLEQIKILKSSLK